MPELWVAAAVAMGVVGAAGLGVLMLRPRPVAVNFVNPREEQLTRRVAQTVGCELAVALPAVRTEMQIAPDQTDETLLKRAVYHYRQNLPEKPCGAWRDRAPG